MLLSALLIAVGLSMDAFTVSLAGGAVLKRDVLKTALTAGVLFGLFQFFMPVIGDFSGSFVMALIAPYGYLLVFLLFLAIGGKMMYDAFSGEEGVDLSRGKVLLVLAVATSIDALAVGVGYALLGEGIVPAAVIIGIVAFMFSVVGVLAGSRLQGLFGTKMEFFGGVVLVLIGLKLLLENVVF
jgi:putative Mn2+ efflux pump MntP